VPDSCQPDCDGNALPDDYELAEGLAADCNENGAIDVCDITAGAADVNRDEVPDECQCIADLNQDGIVAGADLAILLSFWGPVTVFPDADINADGAVDAADLTIVLASWGPCD
jgi:hypothetical protein